MIRNMRQGSGSPAEYKEVGKMADYDLIIIGSGPAGMTDSIYASRANLSVLMLDKLAPG